MASELENTMAGKLKVVGEYHLRPNEMLSEDGRSIICRACGKTRYQRGYSRMHRKPLWYIVNNRADRKFLEVGDGCDCMKRAHDKKELARFEYEKPLFDAGEDGKPTMRRPRRSFDFDYGKQWMLEAVPQWGLHASIADRFYQQRWSGIFEAVASMVAEIEQANPTEKDTSAISRIPWTMVRGKSGELKTSMLCVLRYSLLSNSYPTVMVNVPQLLGMKKRKSELWDFVCEVLALLVDDVGKATLSKEQSGALDEIIGYRKRTSKLTIAASSESLRGLRQKGYSDSLVQMMGGMFDLDMSMMEDEEENILF